MNRVQKFRESQLLGKAELARRAGVSESTIDRVEAGHGCRMETKRKILFALGLSLQESTKLFQRPRKNGSQRQATGARRGQHRKEEPAMPATGGARRAQHR